MTNDPRASGPLLEVKALAKRYGRVAAIDSLDLTLERGETVVVMGPSGCGKSTTIRCIDMLTIPDSGSIGFDGVELTQLPTDLLAAVRRRIGFVFQSFNLIHRLNCLENASLGLVAHGVPRAEARDRAQAALDSVGLGDQGMRWPSDLSGGGQQRVAIARALALDPELMLWDEPTASLDPILVREVLGIMEDLAAGGRRSMVVVTHELGFARRAADRVVLMESGRIVEQGPPGEVFANPSSSVGRKYKDILSHA